MTNSQRLKAFWRRIDIFVLFTLVVVLAAAGGASVMNWINSRERGHLVDRFPVIRAEERAACVREFQGKVDDLTRLNLQGAQSLADLREQMGQTQQLVASTLHFLGDRAKLTDARQEALLRQTKEAALAATAAQKSSVQVEKNVAVAATKADEAASTAQAVSKKLDTAVHPALPAKPWIGSH